MVAVERSECAEHGPAGAEDVGGVFCVAADVGAGHGELVDGGECDRLGDGDLV